eukprot:TRINITY_DN23027_c0_g1_i1.p1 TRINITY_DN23027_c0_g1~~TRINITY_DN23027_c0_g1_i1.p1  ORF type:complete len:594 (-),score=75.23 TRINITY_DN23027_c0_g1_i1:37-1818(-)
MRVGGFSKFAAVLGLIAFVVFSLFLSRSYLVANPDQSRYTELGSSRDEVAILRSTDSNPKPVYLETPPSTNIIDNNNQNNNNVDMNQNVVDNNEDDDKVIITQTPKEPSSSSNNVIVKSPSSNPSLSASPNTVVIESPTSNPSSSAPPSTVVIESPSSNPSSSQVAIQASATPICPVRVHPTPMFLNDQSVQLLLSCDFQSSSTPCLNDPAVRQFYERIYPPFALRKPNFMQDEDRKWWDEKAYALPNHTYYGDTKAQKFPYITCPSHIDLCKKFNPHPGQLPGEYVVMHSSYWTIAQVVIVDGKPGGGGCARWDPHVGYKHGIDTHGISAKSYNGPEHLIVHAISEEANSFQHFIDTLFPKLLHAWDFIDPATHPDIKMWALNTATIPTNILDHIGFGPDRRINRPNGENHFLWLCYTPTRHPIVWKQMHTMLGVKRTPDEQRTNILFLRRPLGRERAILNQDELLNAMNKYIDQYNAKCGTKYQIILLQQPPKNDIASLVEFFSKTKMLIGAHGGAMYNLLFCPPGTITVELFPKERFGEHIFFASFWQISRYFDGEYYLMPKDSLEGRHNMQADINLVMDIFKKEFPMPN